MGDAVSKIEPLTHTHAETQEDALNLKVYPQRTQTAARHTPQQPAPHMSCEALWYALRTRAQSRAVAVKLDLVLDGQRWGRAVFSCCLLLLIRQRLKLLGSLQPFDGTGGGGLAGLPICHPSLAHETAHALPCR